MPTNQLTIKTGRIQSTGDELPSLSSTTFHDEPLLDSFLLGPAYSLCVTIGNTD